MKRIVSAATLAVVIGLASGVSAQSQFQQVITFHVKAGEQLAWEGAIKQWLTADTRLGGTAPIYTFQVMVEGTDPTYHLLFPVESWVDRDTRAVALQALFALAAWDAGLDPPARIAKALGPSFADVSRLLTESVTEVASTVWSLVPDGSANLGAMTRGRPARYYDIETRQIRRSAVTEHRKRLAEFKAAFEAAPSKPEVMQYVLSVGPASRTVFRRAVPFETMAQLQDMDLLDVLETQLGAGATKDDIRDLQEQTVNLERYVVVLRDDLSRVP